MSGQPEIPERIPKRMTWRYRCCGVPNTRVRPMTPDETKLAWLRSGFHLMLFLLFFSLASIVAAAFDRRLSFPAIAINLVLLLYGAVNFYALWAYLRCLFVHRVITFSIDAEDLTKVDRQNMILKRLLVDCDLPVEFEVWMPSRIAVVHSKKPYACLASWAVPIPARIERFATTNPSFISQGPMTCEDRLELTSILAQLVMVNFAHLVASLAMLCVVDRFAITHDVVEPSIWKICIKLFAYFAIVRFLQRGYRHILIALDIMVGRLDSKPGASASWLRYSRIPWFEHSLPAAWRTNERHTDIPAALPRSVTKRIPV